MEEKKQFIIEKLSDQDLFQVYEVTTVNHKPHAYMIGPKHINSSSIYLNIEECEKNGVTCAHPGCQLKYEDHTYEEVCFLKLTRNGTPEEASKILKELVDIVGEKYVDGFSFIETKEKFRIN